MKPWTEMLEVQIFQYTLCMVNNNIMKHRIVSECYLSATFSSTGALSAFFVMPSLIVLKAKSVKYSWISLIFTNKRKLYHRENSITLAREKNTTVKIVILMWCSRTLRMWLWDFRQIFQKDNLALWDALCKQYIWYV